MEIELLAVRRYKCLLRGGKLAKIFEEKFYNLENIDDIRTILKYISEVMYISERIVNIYDNKSDVKYIIGERNLNENEINEINEVLSNLACSYYNNKPPLICGSVKEDIERFINKLFDYKSDRFTAVIHKLKLKSCYNLVEQYIEYKYGENFKTTDEYSEHERIIGQKNYKWNIGKLWNYNLHRLLPDYLVSTYNLLINSFPEGIEEKYYMPILAMLDEGLGFRNMAEIMSICTGRHYYLFLNESYGAWSYSKDNPDFKYVEKIFKQNGYDNWIKEQ